MSFYSEEVEYFGSTESKKEIEVDKEKYWKKWPVREETITSPIEILWRSEGLSEVRFKSRFRNEDPANDAWISADLSNQYVIRRTKGNFFIVEQSCEVSKLEKSEARSKRLVGFFGGVFEAPGDLTKQIALKEGSPHPKSQILALEAANAVRLTLIAEAKRDIAGTMKRFAYLVKYFNEDLSSEAIRMDKQEYFTKWPTAEDKVISKYRVEVSNNAEVTVNVTTSFKVTNASGTMTRSGLIDHTFKLAQGRENLRIFEQVGKVRNLETKKLK